MFPMLVYMRFGSADRVGPGLWLPLFLLWLLLLPLMALVLVVTLLTDGVLWLLGREYHHYTLLLSRCLGVLGATRGITVRVRSKDTVVDIDLV